MRHVSRAFFMLIASLLASAGPASAQQNSLSQEFDDVRNAIGLGQTRAPIDFTERPPLVVPPTYNLPPPDQADTARLPINDPDIETRRRALVDPRRPVPPTDPGAAATGRSARTYLIDPPAGMRDPDIVAAGITHDTSAAPATRRVRHVKKKSAASSQQ